MIRPQLIRTKFIELAEAAFERAAEDVVQIARQTGTPVLAYDEKGNLPSIGSQTPSKDKAAPQEDQR